MAFLHNETTWTVYTLTQAGEKSSYVEGDSITGHLKPYSLEDTTFEVSWIDGKPYKFTLKLAIGETISINNADRIVISGEKYIVKSKKYYKGIWFNTLKLLLTVK